MHADVHAVTVLLIQIFGMERLCKSLQKKLLNYTAGSCLSGVDGFPSSKVVIDDISLELNGY